MKFVSSTLASIQDWEGIDYDCRRISRQKIRWRICFHVTIHKIDKWYPSSKTCECGCINKGLSLRDRTWVCPACGAVNDRDILAARNILRKGISELESKSNFSDSNIGVSCACIQESHLL